MKKWQKSGKELIYEIENCRLRQNELRFWYIGQCGFVFKFNKKIVVIDAVLSDFSLHNGISELNYNAGFKPDELKVDYILCTHGHPDHLEPETIRAFQKKNPDAKVYIPSGCKRQAENEFIKNLIPIVPYKKTIIDKEAEISMFSLSAAHPVHILQPDNPQMCLCYMISFGNKNILHLGDTYLTEELFSNISSLPPITLFLPPINGDDFFKKRINLIGNMGAEEAAKLAAFIKPVLSVPTHYDMVKGNTADPQRFIHQLKETDPNIEYKLMELGEGCFL